MYHWKVFIGLSLIWIGIRCTATRGQRVRTAGQRSRAVNRQMSEGLFCFPSFSHLLSAADRRWVLFGQSAPSLFALLKPASFVCSRRTLSYSVFVSKHFGHLTAAILRFSFCVNLLKKIGWYNYCFDYEIVAIVLHTFLYLKVSLICLKGFKML